MIGYGRRAKPSGLLQKPQYRRVYRLLDRRRLRLLRPDHRPAHGRAHSRQSDAGAAEHGRRRQLAARQLALSRRAAGRLRIRHFRRGIAFDPLLIGKGDQFDAAEIQLARQRQQRGQRLCRDEGFGITKFEDLFTKELAVGGTGTSADTDQFPRVLNNVLGTHFKIIEGYPGGNDVVLAMERGEVQRPLRLVVVEREVDAKSWIDDKKMIVLVQLSLTKHPELPDVPLGHRSRQERRAARDPQDGVCPSGDGPALRARRPTCRMIASRCCARPSSADDEDRTSWLKPTKADLEINPVSGEDVEKLVKEVYATPADIVAKAKEAAK